MVVLLPAQCLLVQMPSALDSGWALSPHWQSQAVGIGLSRDLAVNSQKGTVNSKLKIEVYISLKTKPIL